MSAAADHSAVAPERATDSLLRGRMIFLVGARRSGTNWLQRILAAHPDVVGLPSETYLFSHGIEPLTTLFQHANPGSPTMGRTFMERQRFLDAVRDLADQVFLDNLERLGPSARYLVERTPMHASHLELIADIYPDARVIHIVRDGRAVARSLLSMGFATTIEEGAEEWRTSVAGGRSGRDLFGERHFEVVYERLLSEPEAGISELFGWLGLDLSDDTRERILVEAASQFNVDPRSPGVRAEKWRDELTAADLGAIERIAGSELREYGYGRAAPGDQGTRAAPSVAPPATARRLRGVARRLRHPRSALRLAAAGRARRTLQANHQVVERFERMVAEGRTEGALATFGDRARVRIAELGETRDGRGTEAAEALVARLEEHRLRGLRPVSGHMHASPAMFTTVLTYELRDGSRWTRTLVISVADGELIDVAMHRFPVSAPR